tara:strand:+ start:1037 stop:1627 length:591 start_codon:yes stop_codon:yes gene_type:complete
MNKITEIIIGTNNIGKYREISNLLPKKIKKYSPKDFKIKTPVENGKSFEENSILKAAYFSKKTKLICLSDDSGLEIKILKGAPGIFSSRWAGKNKNFNDAIDKIFRKMSTKTKNFNNNSARFVCCLTLYWPNGDYYISKGFVKGKISNIKKGNKGFGYDPIFIPNGYDKTFGEMEPKLKMSIDHRFKAYSKIKKFF